MSEVAERIPIPARGSWSAKLESGSEFRIIDAEGGQAADLFVYNPSKPTEHVSAQHTRVHMGEIYPKAGWTFVSNERRPMLEFTEDTSPGRHDCLAAACDQFRYELLGAGSDHGSCEQNLQAEAAKYGIDVQRAPQPINVFANFRAHEDGSFTLDECVSKAGDAATFMLLDEGVVIVSACPQDIVGFQPGGPSDMAIELLA
ncbi:MAG: urea carboxylase-associated family protein [Solirubrobacterales bacterium]